MRAKYTLPQFALAEPDRETGLGQHKLLHTESAPTMRGSMSTTRKTRSFERQKQSQMLLRRIGTPGTSAPKEPTTLSSLSKAYERMLLGVLKRRLRS